MKTRTLCIRVVVTASLCATAFAAGAVTITGQQPADLKPDVRILEVPPARDGDPIATYPISGSVKGVDSRTHKVIVFAYAGHLWWVQPTALSFRTPIDDGKWDTDTHPGYQYAVVLVTDSFKPEPVSPKLPDIGKGVLAIDQVAGRKEQ